MVKKNDFFVCIPIQDIINASKLVSVEELGYLLLKTCGQEVSLSETGNVFYDSICSFQDKQHQKYLKQQKINIERHNKAEERTKQKTDKKDILSSIGKIKYNKQY